MICEFLPLKNGCRCTKCGRIVKKHNGINLIAECLTQCNFLLGDLDKLVKVKCGSCKGNVQVKMSVFTCEVFGECLPNALHENSSGVKGCAGCLAKAVTQPVKPVTAAPG